jgi:hypothetical protein
MEDYVARDQRTVDTCLEDIRKCDFYVGIFAKRYGWILPEQGVSITELEYIEARKNKPCLLFLLDKAAPWPLQYVDSDTGDGNSGALIRRLRSELEPFSPSFFKDQDDLVRKVMQSVHLAEAALPDSPIALPNLLNDSEPLLLNSSSKDEIESKLGAVREAENATSLVVDLEQTWWNTRLHLLAAIARDYTKVRHLIFLGAGGRFLGFASPNMVRRKLCQQFIKLEISYLNSVARANDAASSSRIASVVSVFRDEMRALPGGEEAYKTVVKLPDLREWLGDALVVDSIEVKHKGVTPASLHAILTRDTDIVALTCDEKLLQVVDRVKLASHIARDVLSSRLNLLA